MLTSKEMAVTSPIQPRADHGPGGQHALLVAHLLLHGHLAAARLRPLHDARGFVRRQRQGLLAHHVLAGIQGQQRDLHLGFGHDGDVDDGHVGVGQQSVQGLVDARDAVGLGQPLRVAAVARPDGRHGDARRAVHGQMPDVEDGA